MAWERLVKIVVMAGFMGRNVVWLGSDAFTVRDWSVHRRWVISDDGELRWVL